MKVTGETFSYLEKAPTGQFLIFGKIYTEFAYKEQFSISLGRIFQVKG